MRITGGHHRSRHLLAPRGSATRPTSDRVREALFGILTSLGVVDGARVLDLYAGTGALALEAISRGAATATMVERAREATVVLRANVTALGVQDRATVVAADVEDAIARVARDGPFDLVLMDPPWSLVDAGGAARTLTKLAASGALAVEAVVVLEHAARSEPPVVAGLATQDTRRYGDTALTFYKPAILRPSGHAEGTTRPSE